MNHVPRNLAAIFIVLFAVVWITLSVDFLRVDAADKDGFVINDAVVTVAEFLAASVAAGTAAVLGIEIQRISQNNTPGGLSQKILQAKGSNKLLAAGVYTYAGVGLMVLATWMLRPDTAPQLFATFGLTVLGWFAGVFSAIFNAG